MSSSMAREGARRLGAAKYPSTACDDDGDSSSMDERRLFLLCVFKHLSFRTEAAYIGWVKRFILFHDKRHPKDMGAAEDPGVSDLPGYP